MILRRVLARPGASRLLLRNLSTTSGDLPPGEPHTDLTHGTVLPSDSSENAKLTDANAPFTAADTFAFAQQFQKTSGQLGSRVGKHYQPHRVVTSPPKPKDITLELLLASGAHLGHATSLWNPGNQRYILGVRQGIHIIALEQIAAHLRRAAKVVEGVARNGGLILFVGTRPGQERCVVEAANHSGGCHLFEKWIPGTITNGKKIVGHGEVIPCDQADQRYPEGPIPDGPALRPDLVVCLNPLENFIMLRECGQFSIPTIGIIDTDADPTWVTYPIPANDDSLRCTQLIAGVLGRAGESGKQKRLQVAVLRQNEVERGHEALDVY